MSKNLEEIFSDRSGGRSRKQDASFGFAAPARVRPPLPEAPGNAAAAYQQNNNLVNAVLIFGRVSGRKTLFSAAVWA